MVRHEQLGPFVPWRMPTEQLTIGVRLPGRRGVGAGSAAQLLVAKPSIQAGLRWGILSFERRRTMTVVDNVIHCDRYGCEASEELDVPLDSFVASADGT